MNVLFVCGRNRMRSPTAKLTFALHPGIDVASAGINPGARAPLSSELVKWADLIFVMEKGHQDALHMRYKAEISDARVVCLDIPDEFGYMEESLVNLLRARVTPCLPPWGEPPRDWLLSR